jgi:hypothetical protein
LPPSSIANRPRRLQRSSLPSIDAELIDAGLVQDLYLTTSPVIGGEPGTPMYSRPLDLRTVVRKRGTLHQAGVLFEHSLLAST